MHRGECYSQKMKNNNTIDPFAPLDKYEEDLMKSVERDEWTSVADKKKEIDRYTQLFRNESGKDKRITIRVASADLQDIKTRASLNSLPYQTLINILLHQYAKGRIDINL